MNIRITLSHEAAKVLRPGMDLDSLEQFVGNDLRRYYGEKLKSVKFSVGREGRYEVDVPGEEEALEYVVDDAMTNWLREMNPYTGWKKEEMN
jgi:hypothetical protein